jgi:hypothetical protein
VSNLGRYDVHPELERDLPDRRRYAYRAWTAVSAERYSPRPLTDGERWTAKARR